MIEHAPHRLTIIRDSQNSYYLATDDFLCGPKIADGLEFDEMLGFIARVFCPTHDDGTPIRRAGRQLFLTKPDEKNHPDFAGDLSPTVGEDEDFVAIEFTTYHWQVRRTVGKKPISIWNIYPTKQKVVVDPNHKGPILQLPKNPTLENCRLAAEEACRKVKTR